VRKKGGEEISRERKDNDRGAAVMKEFKTERVAAVWYLNHVEQPKSKWGGLEGGGGV